MRIRAFCDCCGAAAKCVLCLILLPFVTGCAKTGEPHPPRLMIPKPTADLKVRQYGDQALLSVSLPAENTDGSPVTTLATVEVYRLTEQNRQSALPGDEEFLKRAQLVFAIPVGKLQPFLQDKTITFRDPLEFPDRTLIYSRSFCYAFRFVNDKDQAAGLTNRIVFTPVPAPPAPNALSYDVTQDYIRIRWEPPSANMDGSTPPRIAGYNVYKSTDPAHFPANPMNAEPLPTAEVTDHDFQFDATYHYRVTVVASRADPWAESLPSAMLQVTPRDTFPPGVPQNANAVLGGTVVLLLWAPSAGNDVAGYRIYRKEQGASDWIVLQESPLAALSYRDATAQPGKSYTYRITAVDTHGNESLPAEATVELPL